MAEQKQAKAWHDAVGRYIKSSVIAPVAVTLDDRKLTFQFADGSIASYSIAPTPPAFGGSAWVR